MVDDLGKQQLLTHVDGPVGRLTFNNPARANALTLEMCHAIPKVLDAFDRDRAVRVVVVHGSGGRAFMSGGDLTQLEDPATSGELVRAVPRVLEAFGELQTPLIAMIGGQCLGAGLAVALRADLRIATHESRFGVPAARLGLAYPVDEVQHLVGLAGPGVASDLLLSARVVSAGEAHALGLVHELHARNALEASVAARAREIAANAPLAVRAMKAAIRAARGDNRSGVADEIAKLVQASYDSHDFAEGQQAFRQRRSPHFTGS